MSCSTPITPNSNHSSAPVVSVIIPMYNTERYIDECIASLRAQTFPYFEAFCVDDASEDASFVSAQRATAGDARFTCLQLPQHGGQSVARNVALEQARGEYVVLLDSDDYLVPCALEHLVAYAHTMQLDELYFNARSFYESPQAHQLVREDFSNRPSFSQVVTGLELFTFFQQHDAFFPQAALRMVRRDLIEKHAIRFYEGIIHEDVLFTFMCLAYARRSSFLNEQLYMRRVRMGSTMVQPKRTIDNVRGHYVCMREITTWVTRHESVLSPAIIDALAKQLFAYRALCARDWVHDIDPSDKQAFLASLSVRERFAFSEDIIALGTYLHAKDQEFYRSCSFRVGNALLAAPRAVRNMITRARSFRKDNAQ